MSKMNLSLFALFLVSSFEAGLSCAQGTPGPAPAATSATDDWLTYGYDPERTGWNRGETTLSKDNVSKLAVLWSTLLSTKPTPVALATLSPPVVVSGVKTAHGVKNLLFLLGADDT